MLLPPVLAANAALVQPGSDLAARFDWVLHKVAEVYGGLSQFADWAGAHGLLRLAVRAEDRPRIAEAARVASSMRANPVDLSAATLAQIIAQAG